jgi:Fe2+ or Zn2+ uptake regulation protein
MSAPRPDPELVRTHVLDTLGRAGGELTTAEVRQLLLPGTPGLVNEIVYRNLVILEHRGQVRRLRLPGRRHVAWALNAITATTTSATGGHRR